MYMYHCAALYANGVYHAQFIEILFDFEVVIIFISGYITKYIMNCLLLVLNRYLYTYYMYAHDCIYIHTN